MSLRIKIVCKEPPEYAEARRKAKENHDAGGLGIVINWTPTLSDCEVVAIDQQTGQEHSVSGCRGIEFAAHEDGVEAVLYLWSAELEAEIGNTTLRYMSAEKKDATDG